MFIGSCSFKWYYNGINPEETTIFSYKLTQHNCSYLSIVNIGMWIFNAMHMHSTLVNNILKTLEGRI